MTQAPFEKFTKKYQLSKTLRFELRPVGLTRDNLDKSGILNEDLRKAEDYILLKGLMDECHREFIEESLSRSEIDWSDISQEYSSLKKAKETEKKDAEKKLEKISKEKRKEVMSLFDKERKKYLLSEKIIKEALPKKIEEKELSDFEAPVSRFDRFTTYFTGYHEARENVYGEKINSVASRIVDDNLPIFLKNIEIFHEVLNKSPDVVSEVEEIFSNQLSGKRLSDVFDIGNYNSALTQQGIDEYNAIVGGKQKDDGVLHGLNVKINLLKQADPQCKLSGFSQLKKQILSDRTYFIRVLDDDSQAFDEIGGLKNQLESTQCMKRAVSLFSSLEKYDLGKVYVSKAGVSEISSSIFGKWDAVSEFLIEYYYEIHRDKTKSKMEKNVKSLQSRKQIPLSDILAALKDLNFSLDFYAGYIASLVEKYEEVAKDCELSGNLRGNEEKVDSIKAFLDSIMSVYHSLKPFSVGDTVEKDFAFYSELEEILNDMDGIWKVYNLTRNYVTSKPFSSEKVRLKFGIPELGAGWDKNKEDTRKTLLLRKDGLYYVAIARSEKGLPDFVESEAQEPYYEKMEYRQITNPVRNFPRIFILSSKANPPPEIRKGYERGSHKTSKSFCKKLIDYYKSQVKVHDSFVDFDYTFKNTDDYADISEFFEEVRIQSYKMGWSRIPQRTVDEAVESGDIFLFQVYNKDYAPGAKGNKNLHTLYWEKVFCDENLENKVFKLSGGAELFFREKSEFKMDIHRTGSFVVNKKDIDKKPIPEDIHRELYLHANGNLTTLSDEAKEYKSRAVIKEVKYDIIKDRRYHYDSFKLHVPIVINYDSPDFRSLNDGILDTVRAGENYTIMGIDRGERNLIYVCVTDPEGNILMQKGFNVVGDNDYGMKLGQRQAERASSRKSWRKIDSIKEMKSGYLSIVIHDLSKIIIEKNCLVFMEDLDKAFKRSRQKIEKQTYQKFENMLTDKLNYLCFKDRDSGPGSVGEGYQLTGPSDPSGRFTQNGALFYVLPHYTSKIDPTTGFCNLFRLSKTTLGQKVDFLSKMKGIRYDADLDAFAFKFDYNDFPDVDNILPGEWEVFTKEKKRVRGKQGYETRNPTSEIKAALEATGIPYRSGKDLKESILEHDGTPRGKRINAVFDAFSVAMEMRTYDLETGEDNIISPVKNKRGTFFKTSPHNRDLPADADANGAYNIALKGKMILDRIKEGASHAASPKNKDWINFVRERNK